MLTAMDDLNEKLFILASPVDLASSAPRAESLYDGASPIGSEQ